MQQTYKIVFKVQAQYMEFDTKEEADAKIEELMKLNKRESYEYYYADMYTTNDGKVIHYILCRRTDNKLSLEEADKFTTRYEDEKELLKAIDFPYAKTDHLTLSRSRGGKVELFDIMYKSNEKLLSYDGLLDEFGKYSTDISFLSKLIDDPLISRISNITSTNIYKQTKDQKNLQNAYNNLYRAVEDKIKGVVGVTTSHEAIEFFRHFINETKKDDKKTRVPNYYRNRLIATRLINYMNAKKILLKNEEAKAKENDNKRTLNAQITMFEYAEDKGIKLK